MKKTLLNALFFMLIVPGLVYAEEITFKGRINTIKNHYAYIEGKHVGKYPIQHGLLEEAEFYIKDRKVTYKTMQDIGYTHEAYITLKDGKVVKVVTLEDDI